jgi:hypothetical protein
MGSLDVAKWAPEMWPRSQENALHFLEVYSGSPGNCFTFPWGEKDLLRLCLTTYGGDEVAKGFPAKCETLSEGWGRKSQA